MGARLPYGVRSVSSGAASDSEAAPRSEQRDEMERQEPGPMEREGLERASQPRVENYVVVDGPVPWIFVGSRRALTSAASHAMSSHVRSRLDARQLRYSAVKVIAILFNKP